MSTAQLNEREGLSWVDVDYMPLPNKVSTMVTNRYPTDDVAVIGGAWSFTFNSEGKFLMTRLRKRGVDIPGGKVEPEEREAASRKKMDVDEVGKQTAIRETHEETKVKIKNLQLVWRKFTSEGEPAPLPPGQHRALPFPLCYFLYYYAEVDVVEEFVEEMTPNGAVERLFLSEENACNEPKTQMHKYLFEEAVSFYKRKHNKST